VYSAKPFSPFAKVEPCPSRVSMVAFWIRPFGAFGKGITMKMGQTNMHNYMMPLLERIEKGQMIRAILFLIESRSMRHRRCI
jgi:hypothetical protein